MDYGERQTYKITAELEKKINKAYAQAEKELQEKLEAHLKRYEKKDKQWQKWVEDGTKTKEEYKQWRMGQMAIGKRWKDQRDALARDLIEIHNQTYTDIKKRMPEITAANINYATYQVEHDAGIDTSFTLYNKEAVQHLLKDNPDLLPPLKDAKRAHLNAQLYKDYMQTMQSVMIQGIMQGESIPKLAKKIAERTGEKDRKAAIRNARTMATCAQNKGRYKAYERAQDKGVELEKMWLATMDNRTRHTHRWLHEETKPLEESFSNGCEYPADPKGDPSEIYNCRCSMRAVVKGLERRAAAAYKSDTVAGMSYDEWLNAKPVYKSKK